MSPQIQSRSFNCSFWSFSLHVPLHSSFFPPQFPFSFSFVLNLLLWVRNHLYPTIHAHNTNGITLLATRIIVILQFMLPEQEVDGTSFTTMDTNISDPKCSIIRIVVCLFQHRPTSQLLVLGKDLGEWVVIIKNQVITRVPG